MSITQWNLENFFLSFYVWWLFFVSIGFGATFFVLIHYASKASWSVTVRRIAENTSLTLPAFFVLGIVWYLGRETIFHHWLSTKSFSDNILNSKRWYLNETFFYARTLFYFIVFTFAAFFYAQKSAKQDSTGSLHITYQLQNSSYFLLILCGLSITFAAFDWIMSLDPHWYSTIFGFYFFVGCYLAFMSFLSIVVIFLRSRNAELKKIFNIEHIHDLGKQVFGYSCFWAYAGFSQYLLIWYGNLPEETMWYSARQSFGWWPIWCLLCVGHFLVPFFLLMSRHAKRTPFVLFAVSIWILGMQYVDIYWLVMPNFFASGPTFGLLDLLIFLILGALFLAILIPVIKKRSVFPMRDPRLKESLNYENI